MPTKRLSLVLVPVAVLTLAGCSREAPGEDATGSAEAVAPASKSLADLLDDTDGMQVVAEGLKETGLAGIFKGNGSYTLLAPEDAAFEQLGDRGKELTRSEDRAALAALLKAHLIPGYVTPQDLSAAIDASKDGQVLMKTMSGDTLTFTRSGSTITVSGSDGARADIDGEALAGGSSVAIPVSGILRKT